MSMNPMGFGMNKSPFNSNNSNFGINQNHSNTNFGRKATPLNQKSVMLPDPWQPPIDPHFPLLPVPNRIILGNGKDTL